MILKLLPSAWSNSCRVMNVIFIPWLNWFWLMPGKSSSLHQLEGFAAWRCCEGQRNFMWRHFFMSCFIKIFANFIIADLIWRRRSNRARNSRTSPRKWWTLMPWNPGWCCNKIIIRIWLGSHILALIKLLVQSFIKQKYFEVLINTLLKDFIGFKSQNGLLFRQCSISRS